MTDVIAGTEHVKQNAKTQRTDNHHTTSNWKARITWVHKQLASRERPLAVKQQNNYQSFVKELKVFE
jgi:hypothetical protein